VGVQKAGQTAGLLTAPLYENDYHLQLKLFSKIIEKTVDIIGKIIIILIIKVGNGSDLKQGVNYD